MYQEPVPLLEDCGGGGGMIMFVGSSDKSSVRDLSWLKIGDVTVRKASEVTVAVIKSGGYDEVYSSHRNRRCQPFSDTTDIM